MSVDYHLMDNRDPFIYKTTDYGKTWKQIGERLPKARTLVRPDDCRRSELRRDCSSPAQAMHFIIRWTMAAVDTA